MRGYHFTSAKHALDDLRNNRMKIAVIDDLNDPFELLGMDLRGGKSRLLFQRWRKQIAQDYGFLCFSRDWHNPLLWSHYADKHKGVCLGFDVADQNVIDVIYTSSRLQLTPKDLERKEGAKQIMARLLSAKFTDWAHEDEVRIFCDLSERDPTTGHFFSSFGDTIVLREIIAGPLCKTIEKQFRDIVPNQSIKLVKARLAFGSYRVVRNKQGFRSDG